MADMNFEFPITSLFMVQNIKYKYLFSKLEQAEYCKTKIEQIRHFFCFVAKWYHLQHIHYSEAAYNL